MRMVLFEQFQVLGSIHSGVRQNETDQQRHGTLNHLARWVLYCGYNIFLVKTLSQLPQNVHVARYKLSALVKNKNNPTNKQFLNIYIFNKPTNKTN